MVSLFYLPFIILVMIKLDFNTHFILIYKQVIPFKHKARENLKISSRDSTLT